MKTYTYSGPPSGVTLDDGTEVLLYSGKTKDLPEDNAYVKALVAQGRLTAVTAPKPKTPKGDKA